MGVLDKHAKVYSEGVGLGLHTWPGYVWGSSKRPCKDESLAGRRVRFYEQVTTQPDGGWPPWKWKLVGHVPGLARVPLVAVDLDTAAAAGCWRAWTDREGPAWDASPIVETSRGIHVYYRLPADLAELAPEDRPGQAIVTIPEWPGGEKAELLCAGKWIVLPPSVHPSGHVYSWSGRWATGICPLEEIPEAPEWVSGPLRGRKVTRSSAGTDSMVHWIEEHGGGETAYRIACEWAAEYRHTADPDVLADITHLREMNGTSGEARYVAARDTQHRLALALACGTAGLDELHGHLAAYVDAVTDPSGGRVRTMAEARDEWLRMFVKPVAEAGVMRETGRRLTAELVERKS